MTSLSQFMRHVTFTVKSMTLWLTVCMKTTPTFCDSFYVVETNQLKVVLFYSAIYVVIFGTEILDIYSTIQFCILNTFMIAFVYFRFYCMCMVGSNWSGRPKGRLTY